MIQLLCHYLLIVMVKLNSLKIASRIFLNDSCRLVHCLASGDKKLTCERMGFIAEVRVADVCPLSGLEGLGG